MNRTLVISSHLDSVGYDPNSKTLEIEFKISGRVYQYCNVPEDVYQSLMQASSKGRYFNAHIKDIYSYTRV